MDLIQTLEESRKALADALDRRTQLDKEINDLEKEVVGLEIAVERRGGRGDAPTFSEATVTPTKDARRWARKPRTQAVTDALKDIYPKTLGPRALTDVLHQYGRDDERDSVAAALAYLKNAKRVERVGYGEWRYRFPEEQLPIEGGDEV